MARRAPFPFPEGPILRAEAFAPCRRTLLQLPCHIDICYNPIYTRKLMTGSQGRDFAMARSIVLDNPVGMPRSVGRTCSEALVTLVALWEKRQ